MRINRRFRRAALGCTVIAICVPTVYACGGQQAGAGQGSGTGRRSGTEQQGGFEQRSGAFTHPTKVNNRFWPLRRGVEYVYTGSENVDGRRVSHSDIFIVTDLVKRIDGVPTVVIWDRDFASGTLQEGELAFQAQDDAGNVWLFGEYPEEYDGGKLTGAPDTWLAGLAHARRGILMHAVPRTGTRAYLQGWAPAVGFADHAQVYRTGEHTCVPAGCYSNVLQTTEWSPDDPHARQLKYYAPGVGNVRVGFSGDPQREVLVLRDIKHLSSAAMAAVDAQALAIDRRGYRVNKRIYGRTHPAVRAATS